MGHKGAEFARVEDIVEGLLIWANERNDLTVAGKFFLVGVINQILPAHLRAVEEVESRVWEEVREKLMSDVTFEEMDAWVTANLLASKAASS